MLTHGNMTWSCMNQVLGLRLRPATSGPSALAPLFHIGGLNGTLNPTLLRGGCVVLVRGFDPPATLAVIAEQRVTSFFAVPTMLDALSRQPDFAHPGPVARCARSAPPGRRCRCRCCAPGWTAGSPCSRRTG